MLWTIGYERLLPDALVAELELAGVRRVIDVRLRPQSRRPGMSKTKLSARLAEHAIAYEHRRGLGTPPEIRAAFRRGALAAARQAYRRHLDGEARSELAELASTLGDGVPTALLCLEAEPERCHRRVICEALQAADRGLEIVEL
jgi:uncharacterized protein (DUF488 family)